MPRRMNLKRKGDLRRTLHVPLVAALELLGARMTTQVAGLVLVPDELRGRDRIEELLVSVEDGVAEIRKELKNA